MNSNNNNFFFDSYTFEDLLNDIKSIKDNFIIKEIKDYNQYFDVILYLNEKKEILIKYKIYPDHSRKYFNNELIGIMIFENDIDLNKAKEEIKKILNLS